MQNPEPSSSTFRDHYALRESASELRRELDRGSCSCCGSGGACRCLLDSLDAFHRHVSRHFEVEEHEWSAPGHANWTSRVRIDALMREHESLRARLAAALTALGEAHECRDAISSALAADIRGILDDLLRHELAEAGLLQRQVLSELDVVHGERVGRNRENETRDRR